MIEKYFYIDPSDARQLINQVEHMLWSKRGIDRHAYLFDNHAVLSTNRLKLRNVTTRDDDLHYLDEIIETLFALHQKGVAVVPILGYCYDPDSADGTGFVIQNRAKGHELFDDAILAAFQVWSQSQTETLYLHSLLSQNEKIEYLLSRTHLISQVPQYHFDKFVNDMLCILNHDILIDSFGQSNFFYDAEEGFQFIDLDAHNDYKYGLANKKPDIVEVVSFCGFVPCHYGMDTELYSPLALDEHALLTLTSCQRRELAEANSTVFQKCIAALRQNGVPETVINKTLSKLKIYGT